MDLAQDAKEPVVLMLMLAHQCIFVNHLDQQVWFEVIIRIYDCINIKCAEVKRVHEVSLFTTNGTELLCSSTASMAHCSDLCSDRS